MTIFPSHQPGGVPSPDVASAHEPGPHSSFGVSVETTGVDGSPATPSTEPPDTRLRYVPALDGIRAISIIGVMFNHSGLGVGAGGFIGVSMFFVLSGYGLTPRLIAH